MWSVQLSIAARESLQTLPEENREAVLAAIGRLTEGPIPPGLPRPYRLRDRPELIVLRADRYRIAYAAVDRDQTITVVDIVAHERTGGMPRVAAAT
jgi:mRNA-degrading endonuclease RelE of RelBE toxin-antitoxin system